MPKYLVEFQTNVEDYLCTTEPVTVTADLAQLTPSGDLMFFNVIEDRRAEARSRLELIKAYASRAWTQMTKLGPTNA